MAAEVQQSNGVLAGLISNGLDHQVTVVGNSNAAGNNRSTTASSSATTNAEATAVDGNPNGTTDNTEEDSVQEIDIIINNVVCTFNLKCHLNLSAIAKRGVNVEYRKEKGMVSMKLRKPKTTASIWSSGKISCTGATSEEHAKQAARRFARRIQKLGFNVCFRNYRIVNVLATCAMPFGIKITQFSAKYPKQAQYEPEIHPGVTYRIADPKATLKIFSTGSITVTAPSIDNVQNAINHIFPLVHEFRIDLSAHDLLEINQRKLQRNGNQSSCNRPRKRKHPDSDEDDDNFDDEEAEGDVEYLEDEEDL